MRYIKQFWNYLMMPIKGEFIGQKILRFPSSNVVWYVIFGAWFMICAYNRGLRIGRVQGRLVDVVYTAPLPDSIPAKWERLFILRDSNLKQIVYVGVLNPGSDMDYTTFFDLMQSLPKGCSYDWLDRETDHDEYVNYMSNMSYKLDIQFAGDTILDPLDGTLFKISLDAGDGYELNDIGKMEAYKRMLAALQIINYEINPK